MSNQITKNQLPYWLAFNQIQEIGPNRWQRLLDYFSDLKLAWQATTAEIIKAGINQKIAGIITEKRKNIDPELEMEKLEKIQAKIITILDSNYPKLLKEIYAPPPLLYYLGSLDINNDFLLAVVGSRKISQYGKQVTSDLVSQLCQQGLSIVSGLALGVDACAHQTALDYEAKTIAVLGSGLNQIYPAANRNLAQRIIASGGAVISEFPLAMLPYKSNFPRRNRIISGLSLGTLIPEASIKSGALITARFALEQNREVFAVPGSIYSDRSAGPNHLIKFGAKMITSAQEILETLNLSSANDFKKVKTIVPPTETEKIILDVLNNEPLHIDKIVQSVRLDISIINSTLALMEMKGLIKNLGNQKYIKSK
jgi:DNA processing protein